MIQYIMVYLSAILPLVLTCLHLGFDHLQTIQKFGDFYVHIVTMYGSGMIVLPRAYNV